MRTAKAQATKQLSTSSSGFPNFKLSLQSLGIIFNKFTQVKIHRAEEITIKFFQRQNTLITVSFKRMIKSRYKNGVLTTLIVFLIFGFSVSG